MISAAGPATSPRPYVPEVLRWVAGPFSFELSSTHPKVLARAREVFGPWLNGSTHRGPSRARYVVEAEEGSQGVHWRVTRNGVSESTFAESIDLALAAIEYGTIAELFAPDSDIVSLHAALLSWNDRGVLLVGPKESGKSTLACALLGAGWRLHSDDTALIEAGPRARGIPRRVSLRASSRELLGVGTWDRILGLPGTTGTRAGVLFHPAEGWPGETPSSVVPAAAILLARRGACPGRARLQPLDAGHALVALAPYCNRREAGIGHALEALQPLADRARAFDLGRGDLAAMTARVAEAVGA